MTQIAIIQGHPDKGESHFCHALAAAYVEGASAAGHQIRRVDVADLDFPVLRSAADFYDGKAPADILRAQETLRWADHLLIVYPLWLGHSPALLHAFLEQTFRPGFAVENKGGGMPRKLLGGKSARIVVTMGMPDWFYSLAYGAHSLKALERNVLGFAGVRPIASTLIGWMGAGVETGRFARAFPALAAPARRQRQLKAMGRLGRQAR
jgi:putative NADPH-quinone reductase